MGAEARRFATREDALDHIAFPYRSASHLVLLHVIAQSGSWEKYGLSVDYDKRISSEDAHRDVPSGAVEFVGGNHVSTYGRRARGDSWVYLGQTVNQVRHALVTRQDSGINGLQDLQGKKVVTRGSHPSLNDWIYLKQHGLDCDREDIELLNTSNNKQGSMDRADGDSEDKRKANWEMVRDGEADATLLGPPASLFAEAAGLRVIDIEPLPMIQFTTVSSSLGFVEKHPDIVDRFLKGMMEGIHFFKTRPKESIEIIANAHHKHGKLTKEQAAYCHAHLAPILEPALYPSMRAISNVYEEAIRQDKDARKINPLELWDMHAIRRIDDSGFVHRLYCQNCEHPAHRLKLKNKDEGAVETAAETVARLGATGVADADDCDACTPT